MTRIFRAFFLFGTMATSACGSSMQTLDIKHNPNPKLSYEIRLTVHDAPGTFSSAEGVMQYEIENKQCAPENPVSGTRNPPHVNVPFQLVQVAENEYVGTVHLDLLKDDDYYGLGVCHWRMLGVNAKLRAFAVTFSSHIQAEKIIQQKEATGYFAKKTFAPTTVKDLVFAAVPVSDSMSKHPENFFSTTLSAREQFE